MSIVNDGGHAFPQPDLSGYGFGPDERGMSGMSLRDWFAGQALAAFIAADGAQYFEAVGPHAIAAYRQADAMLKAREGQS